MNPQLARRLTVANGAARTVLGVVALTAPSAPLAPWIGSAAAASSDSRLLARALGGRDLALGLGTLMAWRHHAPLRGWVEAGGLADAGDTVITLAAWRRLPSAGRWAIVAAAAGGVVAARLTAATVDQG